MKEYVESLGIIAPKAVYHNLSPAELTERAVARGEGTLSNTGALVVTTGKSGRLSGRPLRCGCPRHS